MKTYKETTPILDTDMEAGDPYLAELARRTAGIKRGHIQHNAIHNWIN